MDNMKLNMQYTGYTRHMWNRIFLFACLVAISVCAIAQEKGKSVTGTVTDANGESLIGVSVKVAGAPIGSVTDIDGRYKITVPSTTSVLQFSYIGYVSVQETVGSRSIINIKMKEDSKVIDEVVVVGYGLCNPTPSQPDRSSRNGRCGKTIGKPFADRCRPWLARFYSGINRHYYFRTYRHDA